MNVGPPGSEIDNIKVVPGFFAITLGCNFFKNYYINIGLKLRLVFFLQQCGKTWTLLSSFLSSKQWFTC